MNADSGQGRRGSAGFSLMEALITLMVLSVGLLGLARFQASLWITSREQHSDTRAVLTALSTLESNRYRLLTDTAYAPPSGMETATDSSLYHVRLSVSAAGGITTARVSVSWETAAGQRESIAQTDLYTAASTRDNRLLLPELH